MKSFRAISLCLAAMIALSAPNGSARESARIMALGGESVAGIIPDPYTDLHLSPVHALDFTGTAVWYARRSAPYLEFRSGLPRMTIEGTVYGRSYGPSNEIALQGAHFGKWSLAVAALWSIDKVYSDVADFDLDSGGSTIVITKSARQTDADADAWLLDVAAARPAGDDRAFGIRLRAFGCYKHAYTISQRIHYYYDIEDFASFDRYYSGTSMQDFLDRRIAFDVQCAIARMDGGRPVEELAATFSLHRLWGLSRSSSMNKQWQLDDYEYLSYYRFDQEYADDSREGDLWSAETAYRRSMPGGLRLYAGGVFTFVSFDGPSEFRTKESTWEALRTVNTVLDASLAGDGSEARFVLFARTGRAIALHPSLDVHLSASGAFARSECEANPLASYAYYDNDEPTLAVEAPVVYSSADTRALLAVPFSIDFHPADYFSYFAAFVPRAEWRRQIVETPSYSAFTFEPPAAAKAPGPAAAALATVPFGDPSVEVETRTETFSTGHSFSCGFSFHYRDRLSIDFYTGSDVIPASWNGLYTNITYGF